MRKIGNYRIRYYALALRISCVISLTWEYRYLSRGISSGSDRYLGWTFAIYIRPLATSMCEHVKTTLGVTELLGTLLISERVFQECCALSCFSIDKKVRPWRHSPIYRLSYFNLDTTISRKHLIFAHLVCRFRTIAHILRKLELTQKNFKN